MVHARWIGGALMALGIVGLNGFAFAQEPPREPDRPARPRHILYLTHSQGFNHPVLGHSEKVLQEIGKKAGIQVTVLEGYKQKPDQIDLKMITPEYLKRFDALVFYTTGEPPLTDAQKKAIADFVKGGKGLVGIHAATDTFKDGKVYPEWGEFFGASFKTHGANDVPVVIRNEDPDHPTTKMLPREWKIADEMYQFRESVSRDKFHLLLAIHGDDLSEQARKAHKMEAGKVYEVAWCREYGKGRTFYTSLGHREDVWDNELFQKHLIAGIRWAIGDLKGDATPTAELKKER